MSVRGFYRSSNGFQLIGACPVKFKNREYQVLRAIAVSRLTPRAGKLCSSLSWISTNATFIFSSSLAKRCSSVRPNAGSAELMGLLQNTLKTSIKQLQGYLRIVERNTQQRRTCWICPLPAPLWGTVKA